MSKGTVIHAFDVEATPKDSAFGEGGRWHYARALIDKVHSDEQGFQFYHFILMPGKKVPEGIHDDKDEIYYITSGEALLHMDGKDYDIVPYDLIYIPIGTKHNIDNKSDKEDLVFMIITAWGSTLKK